MSGIRDVVARMAADAAFAEHVRSHPDEVAQQYGLSTDEIEKVLALADAESPAGPAPLGQRLSRSGIGAGGMLSLLSSLGDAADQASAATPTKMVPPKAGLPTFDPTEPTETSTKPHMAVAPAATEPPVEESTSTDQASLKRVPTKMVPPAASFFQPNVDATDLPPSDGDLTGPSVEPAFVHPEPDVVTAPETFAGELEALPPPEPSDGLPVDSFDVNFTKVEFEYKEQPAPDGVRAERPLGWDLGEAKES